MHREKCAKMAVWQKNSYSAILALFPLCIDFKNSFGQMTSGWVLWKTFYKVLLKQCLRLCPGLSISLSRRIDWIVSSFSHRISKIFFVLGCSDDSSSLGYRIGTGPFFCYTNFWNNTVPHSQKSGQSYGAKFSVTLLTLVGLSSIFVTFFRAEN